MSNFGNLLHSIYFVRKKLFPSVAGGSFSEFLLEIKKRMFVCQYLTYTTCYQETLSKTMCEVWNCIFCEYKSIMPSGLWSILMSLKVFFRTAEQNTDVHREKIDLSEERLRDWAFFNTSRILHLSLSWSPRAGNWPSFDRASLLLAEFPMTKSWKYSLFWYVLQDPPSLKACF